ncbi:NAD-dependent epimerase/dehydratase family protein [Plantactinospora sp. KBS50]|uniref:NAD-dependent epimerase/dehydratase family protein n=1 Tax=Plantactinospora sp. KBS50 TaxID=2024580 RepID=UPI001E323480|nr:NAD-dependent epimerase/dehydratase family protein [Plantactinospora sp. KBS50]
MLVTGSHGWVGTHICRLLAGQGHRVVGVGRRPQTMAGRYLQFDLHDAAAVDVALDEVRPDVVFHLAGATPQREPEVGRLVADCVGGTYSIGHALRTVARRYRYRPRLVLAGSSAQYGAVPWEQNPVSEQALPRPTGAYGHAKLAAEATAFALAADGHIEVVAARAFNHVGPGETVGTVAGALARRIADVAAGRSSRVRVGDLDAVRDFTDVRDIARAYLAMAQKGKSGDAYNVCSESGVAIRTVLDILLALANLDHSVVDLGADRGGIGHQVGSAGRLRGETGWTPRIPLRQSLRDLLAEHWSGPLRSGGETTKGAT